MVVNTPRVGGWDRRWQYAERPDRHAGIMPTKRTSPRQITLCAYARFDADKVHVTVVPVGDAFIARGSAVELWVWHRSRRESFVRTRIDDFDQPSGRTIVLDLGEVPGGTCELQAVLVDRWGRECITHLIQSADPPDKPDWWGSRAGLDPGVPAAWTPLEGGSQADGSYAVSCWGRDVPVRSRQSARIGDRGRQSGSCMRPFD